MNVALRVLLAVAGVALVVWVLDAAVRTFLLPRVASVALSRGIAKVLGRLFNGLARRRRAYEARDRVLSLYPPVLLLAYQSAWLVLILVAFSLLFEAAGVESLAHAVELSGSSLFTLGTTASVGGGQMALSYVEAAIGLTLLALLIAFIPTLYAAYQHREISVSRLSVRAGVPATPWGILEIAQSVGAYDVLEGLWTEWETWFIEVGETHTTLPILNFYRTSIPQQTWIGSATSVLDAAALYNSAVDRPASPLAGLCIRSGWLSLRALADYYKVPYPVAPNRTHRVSITRAQFEGALDHLASSGVPVLEDREAAWRDFVGWRVNYDAIVEDFHRRFTCPRVDWTRVGEEAPIGPSNLRGTHRWALESEE